MNNPFWYRPIGLLTLFFLVGYAIYFFFGAVVGLTGIICFLIAYIYLQLKELNKLEQWLSNQNIAQILPPQSHGVWEYLFALLYRHFREHAHHQHRLSHLIDDFKMAAEAMPDGIIMLDTEGRIEWCNEVAEKHLGLDRSRDINKLITYILRQPQISLFLKENTPNEIIFKARHEKNLILTLSLSHYGEGKRLFVSRDITQFEHVQTVHRDFVANVSHELRTPLTVVSGFLETMDELDEELPIQQKKYYFNLMREQTKRMQCLIEDLLILSRLENGLQQDEKVNIPNLVQLLYQEGLSLSHGRHVIQLNIEADVGVVGSYNEIRSAFGNLITNAIRYTPDGGTIVIRWYRQDTSEKELVFSVRDTGIGIAPEHIPRLTERFYRIDRSRSRETGGTGLGLAIVKHIVTRHKALLMIQSTLGKGSEFSITFPNTRVLPMISG